MNTVSGILSRKGDQIVSVSPGTTVNDALKLMAEKNTGSVVVLSNGNYVGIMTERDYSRKVVLKGRNSNDTRVEEIMSTDLPSAKENDTVEYCMEQMTKNNTRYMPVMKDNQLTGIISMSDVVKATILSQKATIDHLQTYINS